jgi:hypothetical protein
MSDTPPEWLPELIQVGGNWGELVETLYNVFKRDFIFGGPRYDGLPVWHDKKKLDGDTKEEGFWHCITRTDYQTGDRLPEYERAKKLTWCRATIDNSQTPDVLDFDYEESSGRIRRYLWVHECDYVVILEKVIRKKKIIAYLLITAFPLDGASSRRKIERKYDERVS